MPTDDIELNMLLVPFPFSISDKSFEGVLANPEQELNWGAFQVRQDWLDIDASALLPAFVVALAEEAKRQHRAKGIDVVVLPELSLNFDIYNELGKQLKQHIPELELFIAGISTNARGRHGNFVAVTTYEKNPTNTEDKGEWEHLSQVIREKHHKWKLDRGQLETYDLAGSLNPAMEWWEDIDLLSRRVDFTAFRHSVLAAMICEDLARVDPCQELLRAIGPNLVVALLMDAPQLINRWPARYATILAEDPGSAVLTLTSRGLMTRQHQGKTFLGNRNGKDRAIALWRDDFHGRPIEIACPNDCQGVWLKAWSRSVTDLTIDGRDDSFGKRWIYGKHKSICIPDAQKRFGTVLGKEDGKLQESAPGHPSG